MRVKQVRKVRRQRRPGYPTRPEVARDPELLRRHMPSAWKKSAQVTAALSLLLAAGCGNGVGSHEGAPVRVAPVFEHGEGRGSSGCIVTVPPAFLSEEDALRLISDELAKAGLSMPQRNVTLEQVLIPRVQFSGYLRRMFGSEFMQNSFPLVADLVNSEKGVVIEYVSPANCDELGAKPSNSTVNSYDCREVAEKVGGAIRASGKAPGMTYGVFYDPMCRAEFPEQPERKPQKGEELKVPDVDSNSPEAGSERQKNLDAWRKRCDQAEAEDRKEKDAWRKQCDQVRATARKESLELLRAQVKDFIEWLKGQGVI